MLEELKEFRDKLDNLMCSCMDKTIVIYGYGYSGRFVLINQFEIMTRQRVVNIYVSKFNS